MHAAKPRAETVVPALPSLRFEVSEAAQILRMSRAQLYNRIHDGTLKPQKDGARTYITRTELERYVKRASRENPFKVGPQCAALAKSEVSAPQSISAPDPAVSAVRRKRSFRFSLLQIPRHVAQPSSPRHG
jgi:excisionase family DNA binding protein